MIRSALGSGSLKKSPEAVRMRSLRPAAVIFLRAMGSTGGKSKDVHRRWGWRRATSIDRMPVALEELHRHQGIEEIRSAALMKIELCA